MIIAREEGPASLFSRLDQLVAAGRLSRLGLDIHGFTLDLVAEGKVLRDLRRDFYPYHPEAAPGCSPQLSLYLLVLGREGSGEALSTGLVDSANVSELARADRRAVAYVVPNTGYPPSFFSSIIGVAFFSRSVEVGLVPIHASAAAYGDRAFIFAGNRKCGKTTIAFSLLREGVRYFADDTTLVDTARGRILHFSVAIKPRADTLAMFPEIGRRDEVRSYIEIDGERRWCSNVETIYPGCAARTACLEWVVFPLFEPGCRTMLQRLPPALAAARLLTCLKTRDSAGKRWNLMEQLGGLCSRTWCYHLEYGSTAELLAVVHSLRDGSRHERAGRQAACSDAS